MIVTGGQSAVALGIVSIRKYAGLAGRLSDKVSSALGYYGSMSIVGVSPKNKIEQAAA